MARGAVPVFVTVRVSGELVTPTACWTLKAKVDGGQTDDGRGAGGAGQVDHLRTSCPRIGNRDLGGARGGLHRSRREGHADRARTKGRHGTAAGIGLREISAVGAGYGDAGDAQCGIAAIGQGHRLRRTRGEEVCIGENQTRGDDRDSARGDDL